MINCREPELWPSYAKIINKFKKDCAALGYHGQYWASELYDWSIYPPGPDHLEDLRFDPQFQFSDIQQAKNLARDLTPKPAWEWSQWIADPKGGLER